MTRTTIQTSDISSSAVTSAKIEDGTIVNGDVNASAAIVSTKLSGVESGLTSVQTFTSSGTWTRPTGITKVMVEVQGAGSGGNNATTRSAATSGSSGGYAKKLIDVSSISTATITVGAGGAGVAFGAANGNAGGSSSWADGTNTITCNGGAQPTPTNDQVLLGGTATGGDINIKGQNGGIQGNYNSYIDTGFGGNSVLGIGGRASANSASSDPDATGYGAGGSIGTATVAPSGSGGPGIVIVTEYK